MPDMYFKIFRSLKLLFAIVSILLLQSCKDVIEEDLSGMDVELVSPPNMAANLSGVVQFNWELIADAHQYQLEVVTPRFDSVLFVRLDTTLTSSGFTDIFSTGHYQWRVRAENDNSETLWSVWSFDIGEEFDFSLLTPENLLPVNQFISSSDSMTFSWSPLVSSASYSFEATFVSDGSVALDEVNIDTTSYSNLVPEGEMNWFVVAMDSSGTASQVESSTIIIDRTPPESATLIRPSEAEVFSNDTLLIFQWDPGIDLLTDVSDSVFVFGPDDQITLLYSFDGDNAEFDTELNAPGTYYWYVKSTDAALNSVDSDMKSFDLD